MHKDFARHTKVVSGGAAGKVPHIWLYTKLCDFCVIPRWRATSFRSRGPTKAFAWPRTGCSSVWRNEFRTSTDQLVPALCCDRHVCLFETIWNDFIFKRHAEFTSNV
eukprot:1174627-Pleurochrysis_carterae.AAC.1